MEKFFSPLIHYAELNKRDWWSRSRDEWIVMAFHNMPNHIARSIDEIKSFLDAEFGIRLERTELETSMERLREAGSILPLQGGWKLAEAAIHRIKEDQEAAQRIERDAFEEWKLELAARYGLSSELVNKLWESLIGNFVKPILTRHGVSTFSLITGSDTTGQIEPKLTIGQLLGDCTRSFSDPEIHKIISDEFPAYFSPSRPKARKYLLGLLECVLAMYSNGIDRATLQQLYEKPAKMIVLLDTNFLFSLLDLHDNPLNEDAKAIIEYARTIDSHLLEVKMHYAEVTQEEFIRNMDWAIRELSSYTWKKELSKAIVDSGDVPGLILAFQRRNASEEIHPEAFFGPYRTPRPHLRPLGITLFEEKFDYLKADQIVIDDAHDRLSYLKERRKTKTWEAVWHDTLLWHFVRSKRPAGDSPADATYFLLTCDYGLVAFDQKKRKRMGVNTPICILPSQFLQMIRFFVPRSEKFDDAVLHSLRLPSLLTKYDVESEKITLRIAQGLAKFSELPEGIAREVLKDDVIKQKIVPIVGDQKAILEAIESDLALRLERERHQSKFYRDEALGKQSEVVALQREITDLRGSLQQREKELADQSTSIQKLNEEFSQIRDQRKQENATKVRRMFMLKWVGILILGAAFAYSLSHYLMNWPWRVDVICISLSVILIVVAARHKIESTPEVMEAAWFGLARSVIQILYRIVIALATIASVWQLIDYSTKFLKD